LLMRINIAGMLVFMILELIRKQIATCGKSLCQISKATGVDKAALSRIMKGGSCKAETADKLLKHFGLSFVKKRT